VHKLLTKLLAKATKPSGQVDLDMLGQFVSTAFEEADHDRRRTDRSIALMVEELDRLNRGLEKTIDERTKQLFQREAELIVQNRRFDAAINNMLQGLCMFDDNNRLLVCNAQYAKMYALTAEHVKVGTPHRRLLEHRLATGMCPMDEEDFVERAIERTSSGKPYVYVNEQADGRIISCTYQPIAGGGWVGVH